MFRYWNVPPRPVLAKVEFEHPAAEAAHAPVFQRNDRSFGEPIPQPLRGVINENAGGGSDAEAEERVGGFERIVEIGPAQQDFAAPRHIDEIFAHEVGDKAGDPFVPGQDAVAAEVKAKALSCREFCRFWSWS